MSGESSRVLLQSVEMLALAREGEQIMVSAVGPSSASDELERSMTVLSFNGMSGELDRGKRDFAS